MDVLNSICSDAQLIMITFQQPFLIPPSIVVVIEGINFAGSPCMVGGSDYSKATAMYVTTTTAWIYAGASPIPANCGGASAGFGQVAAKWIAIGVQ